MRSLAWRLRARPGARQGGFTLVELLVVVVILGILAGVVVFAVRGADDKGQEAAVATDERIIRTAEEVSCAQNNTYASDDDLVAAGLLSKAPEIHTVEAVPLGTQDAQGNCPVAPVGKQAYVIDCVTGDYPDCGVPGGLPPPVILPSCDTFAPTTTTLPVTVPTVPVGRAQALGAGPPRFEANAGQLNPAVRFTSRTPDYTLFLTGTEMVMSLSRGRDETPDVVRMGLVGANADPKVEGLSRASSSSSYLTGSDRSRWLTDVPHFQRVAYRQVYPGIDLVWHGDGGALEYDFVVAPGADHSVIGERFSGADGLALGPEGDLVISTAGGDLTHQRPVVYQDVDGARRPVDGAYRLDGNQVGFDVGAYDPTRPLVIDPVVKVDLSYATYMQSTLGSDEGANAVATDADGSTYLTGYTPSRSFPTQNGYQQAAPADGNLYIFVVKFSAAGQLVYSTYLSGSVTSTNNNGYNGGYAIAVDAARNAYITGLTQTADFPLVPGDRYGPAESATFLTKLSSDGSQILYSTRLGLVAYGTSVVVEGSAVYLAGYGGPQEFYTKPTTPPPANSGLDAFVTKFEPRAGDGVLEPTYSVRLGGKGDDKAYGVAADADGNAYVTGKTSSPDFPVTSGAHKQVAEGSDYFVAKLDGAGTRVWATYLGGSGDEGPNTNDFINGIRTQAGGIALDGDGNAYVTGTSNSLNFPMASAPRQGPTDAFLAKIDPSGNLVRSIYIGGDGDEDGLSVAVDAEDAVYVAGRTTSGSGLVVAGQIDVPQATRPGGLDDGFVYKIDGAGAPVWATYLGGTGTDQVNGMAADPNGNLALAGKTKSTSGFPTKNAFQSTKSGGNNQAVLAARLVTCQVTP